MSAETSALDNAAFLSVGEAEAYESLMRFIINENTLLRYAREILDSRQVPDLIGKSVKAGPAQFANIYDMTARIAEDLEMALPDIYIYEGYQYDIDSNGLDVPRLEITARMIRDFSDDEMRHCIARELTHIKLGHIETELLVEAMEDAVATLSSLPVVNTLNITGGPQVFAMTLRVKAFRWFREAVYSVENFATAYIGNVKTSITSTLLGVFHSREVMAEIDIPSFCDQMGLIELVEGAAATYSKMDEVLPYAPYRIANMLNYAASERGVALRKHFKSK